MENQNNEILQDMTMFDFKDSFVIRATNPENNDYIITIGKNYATPKHFKSKEEAEKTIENKDWNLIATLVIELAEQAIRNKMSNNKKEKK